MKLWHQLTVRGSQRENFYFLNSSESKFILQPAFSTNENIFRILYEEILRYRDIHIKLHSKELPGF